MHDVESLSGLCIAGLMQMRAHALCYCCSAALQHTSLPTQKHSANKSAREQIGYLCCLEAVGAWFRWLRRYIPVIQLETSVECQAKCKGSHPRNTKEGAILALRTNTLSPVPARKHTALSTNERTM
jgi:hypothetical protein